MQREAVSKRRVVDVVVGWFDLREFKMWVSGFFRLGRPVCPRRLREAKNAGNKKSASIGCQLLADLIVTPEGLEPSTH